MVKKTSKIIDFWVYWGKLARLTYPSNISGSCIATWTHWKRTFPKENYQGKIFGFPISIDDNKKKRECKEERKERSSNRVDGGLGDEAKEDLEWQIWSIKIDLDKNLQCLYWSQTFCFDWLINWIFKNSSCPNWEKELTKENIRPNWELKKMIGKLAIRSNKTKKMAWRIHNAEWILYWDTWDLLIWKKWIINLNHKDHKITEIEDTIKELQEKAKIEMTYLDNIKDRLNYIMDLIFCCEININIFDRAIKHLNKLIENFNTMIEDKQSSLGNISKKLLLDFKYDNVIEKKELLEKFTKSKSNNLIEQVSRLVKELWITKNENERLIEISKNKIDQSGIGVLQNITGDNFTFPTSGFLEIKKIKYRGYHSNIDLVFDRQLYSNNINILASYKDEGDSQQFCQIIIDNNIIWNIFDNKMSKINSNREAVNIGTLKLKEGIINCNADDEIDLKLMSWKFDKDACLSIKKLEKSLFDIIIKDVKEYAERPYDYSSDEHEEQRVGGEEQTKGNEEGNKNTEVLDINRGENNGDIDMEEFDE